MFLGFDDPTRWLTAEGPHECNVLNTAASLLGHQRDQHSHLKVTKVIFGSDFTIGSKHRSRTLLFVVGIRYREEYS
jgi:hypothetical protein